jgi:MarR family transcriptional regulator, temperature-dependent positive regulator of motility
MNVDLNIENAFNLLNEIEQNQAISQRDLADKLGFSLGKVNFVVRALIRKGVIQLEKFIKDDNKIGYRYILTPTGLSEKYEITLQFLRQKEADYEKVVRDIEIAKKTLGNNR